MAKVSGAETVRDHKFREEFYGDHRSCDYFPRDSSDRRTDKLDVDNESSQSLEEKFRTGFSSLRRSHRRENATQAGEKPVVETTNGSLIAQPAGST